MPTTSEPLTVRELRRLWKPHKERLQALRDEHPTAIRFHRACSWLSRAQELNGDEQSDYVLINQWIAFNALYGRWDASRREPLPDRECWKEFLDRILALDAQKLVNQVLLDHRPLVLRICEDEYLSSYFWQEPTPSRKGKARSMRYRAQDWYQEKKPKLILDDLLDRIYLLRCQLVHGAATSGGQLNRTPLRHCTMMLNHLLQAVLLVLIDHGADEDWGELCYPPLWSAVPKRPVPRPPAPQPQRL